MNQPVEISIKDARKIALHAQRVLTPERKGRALDATRSAIKHLGYIQIDTISVVERAHHHTLWNRNPRYHSRHLDKLQQQCAIFEYWSHAAAYLPIEDYRYCLPDMELVKSGGHRWYRTDPAIRKNVLDRIRAEGPLQSRDFENHGQSRLPMWEWKPAKKALETLFMEGELMVVRRENFQKVFDLRERVLPSSVDISSPDPQEYCRSLIFRYLRANGLGTAAEISYLRKGIKKQVESALSRMLEEGIVVEVKAGELSFLGTPECLQLLSQPLPRSRARILSPFDNLVIQRKRISRIFDFDYQIECYVPQKKRKHGYFCLPVLWNAGLVARLDCKADRNSGKLVVKNLVFEDSLKKRDHFCYALKKELDRFAAFNGCREWSVDSACDRSLKTMLGGV